MTRKKTYAFTQMNWIKFSIGGPFCGSNNFVSPVDNVERAGHSWQTLVIAFKKKIGAIEQEVDRAKQLLIWFKMLSLSTTQTKAANESRTNFSDELDMATALGK